MDYERLSALDSSFLVQEGRTTYMHIACTSIFEGTPFVVDDGALRIDRLRAYVASRLHLIPRYRQRLAYVPITRDPIWVDDERFDVGYHVRHTSLPRPGTDEQLRSLCGRLLERPLDRARPLWECWLIEGLEHGRFAMLTKVHHCMVDGVAGVELIAALLTMAPGAQVDAAQPWAARAAPSDAALMRTEAARRARNAAGAVGGVARAAGRGNPARAVARTAGGLWSLLRTGLQGAGDMPFNGPIGPHRRVEWLEVELAEIKAIRTALGGTLNDVVLATVAGAMRRFLAPRDVDVERTALRVAIPVNVRDGAEHGAGNRVSAWLADLPIAEHDPWRRLAAVGALTAKLKADHQAEGAHALTEIAEWVGASFLGLALRVLNRTRPYNLIVTNVPGPPMPLYLLDARMTELHPHLPLFENQGLGIALLSYAGRLSWGLVADWELVPELEKLRAGIESSFDELRKLAHVATAARAAASTRASANAAAAPPARAANVALKRLALVR